MTPGSISERVLQVWERRDGSPLERGAFALRVFSGFDCASDAAVFAVDAALMNLRISLFGPQLDAVVRCPKCDTQFDLLLDLSQLTQSISGPSDVFVEADGYAARVRSPSVQDLHELAPDLTVEQFADALFLRCVEEATHLGAPVARSALPPTLRKAAADAFCEQGMESPSADLVCGVCDCAWRSPLDIACALLRDIDFLALRQLDEVSRIASAYHWSEYDILAMSPQRRQFYLEAIG